MVFQKRKSHHINFYKRVLKCNACSSDYIPLKKLNPDNFFPMALEIKKKKFRVKIK